jgi:hypothetical protein
MPRMICLETDDGEVFINLDQICHATVTADSVEVQYASDQSQTFRGAAAHALIQALRHEEKRSARQG